MYKSLLVLPSVLFLLASCAAPQQAAGPSAAVRTQSSTTTVSSVDAAPAQDDDQYETVFVPPPAGSLLGGGSVRVPKRNITGSDEAALLGNIRLLNAAAGTRDERPFVVSAVSKVTGVSAKQLQSQQDRLRLRFGELCAINSIARGNDAKAQDIALQKSKGRTWTDLARANGLSIAAVTQMAKNANDLTLAGYNQKTGRETGRNQVRDLHLKPNSRPGG
ncbi:MAG: hypothetical protein ACR2G0_04985 [Chthoniobacterales bacterium]